MYASCLFCARPLGRNESIEVFPVGRRLAFDAAKGRLWVVCPRCGRWNLSPLEERWEAIESCERAYRGTRLRASTDNIGLARVGDGLELVRVGQPQRPEMAAWRYGSTFAKRYRSHVLTMGAFLGAGGVLLWTGALPAAAAAIPGGAVLSQVPGWLSILHGRRRVVARVAADRPRTVRGRHMATARIVRQDADDDPSWWFSVDADGGELRLRDDHARNLAGVILSQYNQHGGSGRVVRQAVHRLEAAGGADVADTLFYKAARTLPTAEARRSAREHGGPTRLLRDIPTEERLALEMVLHEEAERRALEGELAELEKRWQEAEQIAAIADDLFLPAGFQEFFTRNRRPPRGR
jgi:hypothetical protein